MGGTPSIGPDPNDKEEVVKSSLLANFWKGPSIFPREWNRYRYHYRYLIVTASNQLPLPLPLPLLTILILPLPLLPVITGNYR